MTESRFRSLVALIVAVAGFLAYVNTLTAGFVWDDVSSVLLHEHVKDPSKLAQLYREDLHPFGRGQGNFYRPLLATSFMIDYQIAKRGATPEQLAGRVPDISAFIFHFVNILWHVAAALLLFALLTRLGAPRAVRAAVPLLYVVHPLHTEAVAYVSGRGDPMAAAFMYAALLAALATGTARRRILGVVLSTLVFIAAVLSKESAIIFPFVLALFVFVRPSSQEGEAPREPRRGVWSLAAAAVVLVVYALLRLTILNFAAEAQPGSTTPLGTRLIETGQAYALYLKLMVLPTHLHMERTLVGVPAWVAAMGYLLLAATVFLGARAWKTGRYRLAIAVGWYLVTWFPISGIIPLNAPMAEHWMYMPLAGALWAVAELVWPMVAERPKALRVAGAVVYAASLAFILVTLDRNHDWRDNVSIYRATLAENPNSARIHYNLAVTYDEIEKDNPAGAVRHYEQFLRLAGSGPGGSATEQEIDARLSLADLYMSMGRILDARIQYAAALSGATSESQAPLQAMAAYGLGRVSLKQGDVPQAFQYFRQALQVRPDLGPEVSRLLQGTSLMGSA